MIKVCSMFRNQYSDSKKKLSGDVEIEDGCIYECGSEFTAYKNDELITADSEEELFEELAK